jgi:hypothetical protein
MKPLVMWARINRARLQIHAHTADQVRGLVVYGPEQHQPFVFDLARRRLTLGAGAAARTLQLDELGIELGTAAPDAPPPDAAAPDAAAPDAPPEAGDPPLG